jgi:hypothetical protein
MEIIRLDERPFVAARPGCRMASVTLHAEVSEAYEGCELCGSLLDNGDLVAAQRLSERCADPPSASLA